jgi:hypothetical protein
MKLNINDSVSVKLTDYGLWVLTNHHKKQSERAGQLQMSIPKGHLAGKFQLYDLMNIFGPYSFFPAQDSCFDKNQITFQEEGLDDG